MSKYVSTWQMARVWGCTQETVTRYCREKLIPGAIQTLGGHWRIPRSFYLEAKSSITEQSEKSEKQEST